jgi:hypothetical protein
LVVLAKASPAAGAPLPLEATHPNRYNPAVVLVARHSDFDELGLGYLVDFPGSASFSN